MADVEIAARELQLRIVAVQWDTALPVGGAIVTGM
jgi:hypothetical protein